MTLPRAILLQMRPWQSSWHWLELSCDEGEGGKASAHIETSGNYDDEEITWHKWLNNPVMELNALNTNADDVERYSNYPWPFNQGTGLMVHEALHQQGYNHWPYNGSSWGSCNPDSGTTSTVCSNNSDCSGDMSCARKRDSDSTGFCASYDADANSMPYIVLTCASRVVSRSASNCGLCPERSADDISVCMDAGRLEMIDTYEAPYTCHPVFDPAEHGLGLISFNSSGSVQKPQGMIPHGQFFGGSGWKNGTGDIVVGEGSLAPGSDMGNELVLQNDWGIGVVSMNADALGFRTVKANSYGNVWGGAANWTLRSSDKVVGVGPFHGTYLRDRIVLRGQGGLGFVAINDSLAPDVRVVVPNGTVIPGSNGSWTLAAADKVVGTGDFDGNGLQDLLVQGSAGIAVLSAIGPQFSLRVLDVNLNGTIGSWNLGSADKIGLVGNFTTAGMTGADEFMIRSNWGNGMLGMSNGRFKSHWVRSFGGTISGGWPTSSSDYMEGVGPIGSGLDGIVLRGSPGIAVLSFDSAGAPLILNGTLITNAGSFATGNEGTWNFGLADNVDVVGNFGSPGRMLQFNVRSDWGVGIIALTGSGSSRGLKTQNMRRTNCGGSDDVSCHGRLWGSWMARETDKVVGKVTRADGGGMLLLRSQ